jgi:hypothetical protein
MERFQVEELEQQLEMKETKVSGEVTHTEKDGWGFKGTFLSL